MEMLGTEGPLALKRSFVGTSLIDRALKNCLQHSNAMWEERPFRKVVGNDETCWEAAGYEIPFPSLSRWPYPDYHTIYDNSELMSEEKLADAVNIVFEALLIIEQDSVITLNFKGLVALSNSKYDLYKPFWDPSEPERREIDDIGRRWNYLMDCLPRYFDCEIRILEIAERHEMPFAKVHNYIQDFAAKELVKVSIAALENFPVRRLPPA